MRLTIYGTARNVDACELFHASTFFGSKLMSQRLLAVVDLRLVFIPRLEIERYFVGDCVWEDDNHRPREFTIRLDADMGRRKTLIALAHEMVHLKQYARGELRDMLRCEKTRWLSEQVDTDKVNYWDLPWEIEAHGRELGLYERFKIHWRTESKNARAAYKEKPDSSGTSHTLVLKEGGPAEEDL